MRAMSCLSSKHARCLRADRAAILAGAHFLDVHQQIGEAALDRFEMAEAGIRRIEPLHQFDDVVFEMADRDIVAAASAGFVRSCRISVYGTGKERGLVTQGEETGEESSKLIGQHGQST